MQLQRPGEVNDGYPVGNVAVILVDVTPEDLMQQYRSAFVRGDVDTLTGFFGFPLQVVSVTDSEASVSTPDGDGWRDVLKGILGAYQRLTVGDAVR